MSARLEHALARLLTEQTLRARFSRDPRSIAFELGLEGEDADGLCGLDPGELQAQAQVLEHARRRHHGSRRR